MTTDPTAYAYNADLYCPDCAADLQLKLFHRGGRDDGTTDAWPQPHSGESDTPYHCATCGELLDIPLTADGAAYVISNVLDHLHHGHGAASVLAAWWERYEDSVTDAWTPDDTEEMRDAIGALLRRLSKED